MDVSGRKDRRKNRQRHDAPGTFRVVAGPCTVESEQFLAGAKAVKQAGFEYRGGAFKPRTSPYSFQGLGEEGLKIMDDVSRDLGLKVVTEVMDPYDIEMVMERAGPADRGPQHGELLAAEAGRRCYRGHGPRRRFEEGARRRSRSGCSPRST